MFIHFMNGFYSIGHGIRKIEDFVSLLKKYNIKILIDVRRYPYPRFIPQYNKSKLESYLLKDGIIYIFMGDTLGGRPNDKTCYVDNKINYNILKNKDFFINGINKLKKLYYNDFKDVNISIMCSESDPRKCHRSKLIGDYLISNFNIDIMHIDVGGDLVSQSNLDFKNKNLN